MATEKTKKKFTFPSAFTILFLLLILIAAATWLVPAGSYDYDEDGAPIPGTYHPVDPNPQKLLVSALKGPINGMYGIEGEDGQRGCLELRRVVRRHRCGHVRADHRRLPGRDDEDRRHQRRDCLGGGKLKGKEKWMFPILMTIFAIGGTRYGMAEETLAFYALIITVMLAAGYDGLTAGALILLGAGIGVIGSTVNPFATGIASGFAGTNISEGLIGRVVILVIGTIIGIVFVMRYGEQVKKDPSKSLIYDMKAENEKQFMSGVGRTLTLANSPAGTK